MFRTLVRSFVVLVLVISSACFTSPTPVEKPAPGGDPGTPPITPPGVTSFTHSFALPGTNTPGVISGSVVTATREMKWTLKGPSGYEIWLRSGLSAEGPFSGGGYEFSNIPEMSPSILPEGTKNLYWRVWVNPAGAREWFPTREPDFIFVSVTGL